MTPPESPREREGPGREAVGENMMAATNTDISHPEQKQREQGRLEPDRGTELYKCRRTVSVSFIRDNQTGPLQVRG